MQRRELFPKIRSRVAELLNGYLEPPEIVPPALGSAGGSTGRYCAWQLSLPTLPLNARTGFRVIIIVMEQLRTRRRARGFSLIELLIVIAIILIILAIAVPKLGSARMNANEMAVIREMQTINTMQIQYMSQFQRFATTLAELGPPTSGGPGPQAADLIPAHSPWATRTDTFSP